MDKIYRQINTQRECGWTDRSMPPLLQDLDHLATYGMTIESDQEHEWLLNVTHCLSHLQYQQRHDKNPWLSDPRQGREDKSVGNQRMEMPSAFQVGHVDKRNELDSLPLDFSTLRLDSSGDLYPSAPTAVKGRHSRHRTKASDRLRSNPLRQTRTLPLEYPPLQPPREPDETKTFQSDRGTQLEMDRRRGRMLDEMNNHVNEIRRLSGQARAIHQRAMVAIDKMEKSGNPGNRPWTETLAMFSSISSGTAAIQTREAEAVHETKIPHPETLSDTRKRVDRVQQWKDDMNKAVTELRTTLATVTGEDRHTSASRVNEMLRGQGTAKKASWELDTFHMPTTPVYKPRVGTDLKSRPLTELSKHTWSKSSDRAGYVTHYEPFFMADVLKPYINPKNIAPVWSNTDLFLTIARFLNMDDLSSVHQTAHTLRIVVHRYRDSVQYLRQLFDWDTEVNIDNQGVLVSTIVTRFVQNEVVRESALGAFLWTDSRERIPEWGPDNRIRGGYQGTRLDRVNVLYYSVPILRRPIYGIVWRDPTGLDAMVEQGKRLIREELKKLQEQKLQAKEGERFVVETQQLLQWLKESMALPFTLLPRSLGILMTAKMIPDLYRLSVSAAGDAGLHSPVFNVKDEDVWNICQPFWVDFLERERARPNTGPDPLARLLGLLTRAPSSRNSLGTLRALIDPRVEDKIPRLSFVHALKVMTRVLDIFETVQEEFLEFNVMNANPIDVIFQFQLPLQTVGKYAIAMICALCVNHNPAPFNAKGMENVLGAIMGFTPVQEIPNLLNMLTVKKLLQYGVSDIGRLVGPSHVVIYNGYRVPPERAAMFDEWNEEAHSEKATQVLRWWMPETTATVTAARIRSYAIPHIWDRLDDIWFSVLADKKRIRNMPPDRPLNSTLTKWKRYSDKEMFFHRLMKYLHCYIQIAEILRPILFELTFHPDVRFSLAANLDIDLCPQWIYLAQSALLDEFRNGERSLDAYRDRLDSLLSFIFGEDWSPDDPRRSGIVHTLGVLYAVEWAQNMTYTDIYKLKMDIQPANLTPTDLVLVRRLIDTISTVQPTRPKNEIIMWCLQIHGAWDRDMVEHLMKHPSILETLLTLFPPLMVPFDDMYQIYQGILGTEAWALFRVHGEDVYIQTLGFWVQHKKQLQAILITKEIGMIWWWIIAVNSEEHPGRYLSAFPPMFEYQQGPGLDKREEFVWTNIEHQDLSLAVEAATEAKQDGLLPVAVSIVLLFGQHPAAFDAITVREIQYKLAQYAQHFGMILFDKNDPRHVRFSGYAYHKSHADNEPFDPAGEYGNQDRDVAQWIKEQNEEGDDEDRGE